MERHETEAAFLDAASELIKLLKDNGRPNEAVNVFAMASYVKEMEVKLDIVLQELVGVKEQLDAVQNKQPKELKDYLSEVTDQMGKQYQGMKSDLSEIKTEIKKEASDIVTAFQETGKEALNKVCGFFKIAEKLENFRQKTKDAIEKVSRTIDKIDAFGSGMREAGKQISNAFRAIAGKPEKEQEDKKFSKTEMIKSPFVKKKNHLEEILAFTENAIAKCELLSGQVKGKEVSMKEQVADEIVVNMPKRKGR